VLALLDGQLLYIQPTLGPHLANSFGLRTGGREPYNVLKGAAMRSVKVAAFALLVPMFAAMLWSQTGTSTVRGTVTDPQGRVIPDATLTLTNTANNAPRTVKSSDGGSFTFDFLPPGEYRLEAEASGFKKRVVDNVRALVGKQTEANVQLEVGTVGEVVEVRAANENLVNTQDATLGNNFVSQQITQLPLEGRNLVDLLSLQPGSTREGYVAGARADQSNVTLDGVDINNAQTGNAEIPRTTNSLVIGQLDTDRGDITTGPVLRLNSEAIEEFRVTTANGNANQGRSAGAQINLVTKSGTNNWHGAAFEFYRGTLFEANDWFSNHSGVPRTPLVRNTYGGALGGPVKKNKAFFFYSYEARRDATAQGVTRVVPLANLGQGSIRYAYCADPPACNNIQTNLLDPTQSNDAYTFFADVGGFNPVAIAALQDAVNKYPANDTTQGDGLNTGGFRFNAPTPIRLNSHVAKLDFNLTNNQTVFARANVIYDHQTKASWFPDTPSPLVWNHPWGLAAGHTWTIGNQWVNNFRYGFTRQAFDDGGDSSGNDISFRFVFQPTGQVHTLSRVTPVHNFTDDVSWIHGNHNLQFGGNVRVVSNSRTSFANSFDNGVTNPSFYVAAGDNVSQSLQDYLNANPTLPGSGDLMTSIAEVQNAATALIGRLSQYTANFNFSTDGSVLNVGAPTVRDFATQAYDSYIQDTWKVHPNLTLTLGLRYSLERPVYETKGFEVQPEVPLGTFFGQRLAAAARGQNFMDPIVINRSGPANGGKPMYDWDKNNFQPRIAVAWSPEGGDGFFGHLLGRGGRSVFRGGFALTNDYYGQALAVDWDLNNTLGFSSSANINANTYDTNGSNLAPLFTGFNQDIRTLPNITVPGSLVFPLSQQLDEGERIEQSVDSRLHAPTEYVWNVTYERQLPAGTVFSASYIGRMGRSLLARRDVTAFNNVRDPNSGMDWYTAATILEKQRQQGIDTSQIATIPFFENLFPAGMAQLMDDTFGLDPVCDNTANFPGFDPAWSNTQVFYAMQSRTPFNPCFFFSGNDWTDTQALVDQVLFYDPQFGPSATRFMHPQYGALSAWSTIGNSNYNALAVSLRQRLNSLILDFNYTYSHSFDDASGLQSDFAFAVSPFIVNPIRQHDNYGSSDFDIRHNINADAVWTLPFGKGKKFMSDAHPAVDAVFGGWQISGIFRWNTGLPQFDAYDDARWATNWNVQAGVTPVTPIHTCPDRPLTGPNPKLFGGCGDINAIYQGFRNAYPGESGLRNPFRLPGYIDLDLGLGKTWRMPWSENHSLQVRWDVFNVTNTQHFGAIDTSRTGFGVGRDPALRGSPAPDNWSNFIQIQGQARVMQVGLRYAF
jgi:Carboxypeptidase regulatory-like domain